MPPDINNLHLVITQYTMGNIPDIHHIKIDFINVPCGWKIRLLGDFQVANFDQKNNLLS